MTNQAPAHDAKTLLERLVYAIQTHRKAKARWGRMDLRRPSDRLHADKIRAEYFEALDLLQEAEAMAELYVALNKERIHV